MRNKIASPAALSDRCDGLRAEGGAIVFTNGVFDMLHPGHVDYLRRARNLGAHLVVGINSDASTRRVKGSMRPIVPLVLFLSIAAGRSSAHAMSFEIIGS